MLSIVQSLLPLYRITPDFATVSVHLHCILQSTRTFKRPDTEIVQFLVIAFSIFFIFHFISLCVIRLIHSEQKKIIFKYLILLFERERERERQRRIYIRTLPNFANLWRKMLTDRKNGSGFRELLFPWRECLTMAYQSICTIPIFSYEYQISVFELLGKSIRNHFRPLSSHSLSCHL